MPKIFKRDIADFSHTHIDDTGWINLQLLNGWVNYDSGTTLGGAGRACQIRRLNGVVYFRGVARSGVAGSVAFIVPKGFLPDVTTIYEGSWMVAGSGGATGVNLNASTGEVGLGNSAYTYINGITPYPADR